MTNPKTYSTSEMAAAARLSGRYLGLWHTDGRAPGTIESWGARKLIRYDFEQAARVLVLAELRSRFGPGRLRSLAALLPSILCVRRYIACDGRVVLDLGGACDESRQWMSQLPAVVVIDVYELLARLPEREGRPSLTVSTVDNPDFMYANVLGVS